MVLKSLFLTIDLKLRSNKVVAENVLCLSRYEMKFTGENLNLRGPLQKFHVPLPLYRDDKDDEL